jgi:hypothetical protein
MQEINSVTGFKKLISKENKLLKFDFSDCEFNCKVEITKETHSISFENCIFNKEFKLSANVVGNATFGYSTFNNIADFSKTKFGEKSKARFYYSVFKGETNFDNTTFGDLSDFWNATFYKTVIFYKTDFLGTSVFSRAIFKENVLFTYSVINKLIIFRGATFEKGFDLSLAIILGEISPFDINIENYKSEDNLKDEDIYEKYVSKNGIIVDKNKRETFRILKNHYITQSSSFDYVKYSNLEQKAYSIELKKRIFKKNPEYKAIQDYIIFILNTSSNKLGTSYIRGIGFTLLVGFLFFYFCLLSTENYYFSLSNFNIDTFKECFRYYFQFLIPTHSIDFLETEKPNTMFYLWDFIGRAFVSYGIYQTVQAFRKYKKN